MLNHPKFLLRSNQSFFWHLLIVIFITTSCHLPKGGTLIKGAKVYDGAGTPGAILDVYFVNDEIQDIGQKLKCEDCQVIEAEGLSLAPGFIDLHAHLEPLPLIPDAPSALHQGVTTALGGPDGSSPLRLGKYLDSLEKIGMGINVAYLIGHNTIRSEILHLEDRAPSDEELSQMKALVSAGMEEGAFGISTGLKYLPGAFAETAEVIELSQVAAKYGGIYTSHLREEGLGLLKGVREATVIAQEASIPVVLTHHKAIGMPVWGYSEYTLAIVDSARAVGLDVMIDQYPYTASYTGLSVLIPAWALAGGASEFAKRVGDLATRKKVIEGIIFNIMNDRGGGDLKRIQLAKFDWKPHLEGKTLYDWAIEEGLSPNAENGAKLVIEAQLHRGARAIYHAMDEGDVERIMAHPQTMIASDGRITAFEQGFPHPRVHGTFPRVLGHYARDKGVLALEVAIQKMTSMPAKRLGLSDRGWIKIGAKADLVLFNEDEIIDKATFEAPHQYPVGIIRVWVNGKEALGPNGLSKNRYGVVLRHTTTID